MKLIDIQDTVPLERLSESACSGDVMPQQFDSVDVGSLVFRCPRKRKLFDSGIGLDANTFQKIKPFIVEVECPHCRAPHALGIASGALAPFSRADRSAPNHFAGLVSAPAVTIRSQIGSPWEGWWTRTLPLRSTKQPAPMNMPRESS
jgi:hypothetical protein